MPVLKTGLWIVGPAGALRVEAELGARVAGDDGGGAGGAGHVGLGDAYAFGGSGLDGVESWMRGVPNRPSGDDDVVEAGLRRRPGQS